MHGLIYRPREAAVKEQALNRPLRAKKSPSEVDSVTLLASRTRARDFVVANSNQEPTWHYPIPEKTRSIYLTYVYYMCIINFGIAGETPRSLRGWPPRLFFGNLGVLIRGACVQALRAAVRTARSGALVAWSHHGSGGDLALGMRVGLGEEIYRRGSAMLRGRTKRAASRCVRYFSLLLLLCVCGPWWFTHVDSPAPRNKPLNPQTTTARG